MPLVRGQQTGCVLSQMPVSEKTNEINTAPEILQMLVLEGRVVTGEAMFAQTEICRMITDSGGDYLIVVKDNQGNLKEDIEGDFLPSFPPPVSVRNRHSKLKSEHTPRSMVASSSDIFRPARGLFRISLVGPVLSK